MSRHLTIALLTAAALAVLAAPASAGTVSSRSGPLSATLHAGTHHPRANRKWPVRVTATWNGRSVRAGAYYQFLYNGQQVSKQAVCGTGIAGCNNWGFKFTGSYRDTLVFPNRAVGFPLVVRVVVSAYGRTVYVPYSIQVVK